MATQKQIEANRRNSLKSTGPRTQLGKEHSSQNARKMGIFSREVHLPGDNPAELQTMSRKIRADLAPCGALEEWLADTIVATLFRLRRLLRIEAGLFDMYQQYKGVDGGVAVAFAHDASQMECIPKVMRCEKALQGQLYRALDELRRLQRQRTQPESAVIEVAARTCDSPQPVVNAARRGRWPQWLGLLGGRRL